MINLFQNGFFILLLNAGLWDFFDQTLFQNNILLTGDNDGAAKIIAAEANVGRYFANLLPEDKLSAIQKLQNEGYTVAMVGDRIKMMPSSCNCKFRHCNEWCGYYYTEWLINLMSVVMYEDVTGYFGPDTIFLQMSIILL